MTWHTSAKATAGLKIDTVSTLGADILEGRWILNNQMHNVMLSSAMCYEENRSGERLEDNRGYYFSRGDPDRRLKKCCLVKS